jgi:hypothetical protein
MKGEHGRGEYAKHLELLGGREGRRGGRLAGRGERGEEYSYS